MAYSVVVDLFYLLFFLLVGGGVLFAMLRVLPDWDGEVMSANGEQIPHIRLLFFLLAVSPGSLWVSLTQIHSFEVSLVERLPLGTRGFRDGSLISISLRLHHDYWLDD